MGVAAFLFFFIKGLVWLAILLGAGNFLRDKAPDFVLIGSLVFGIIAAGTYMFWLRYRKRTKELESEQTDRKIIEKKLKKVK